MNVRFPTAALAALGFATLLLAACASQPRPLQGDFAEVSPYDAINIDSTGAMVRWGGRIVRTEPRPNHTCFEVLSTRLGSYGRPYWAGDDVGNRFIAVRRGDRWVETLDVAGPGARIRARTEDDRDGEVEDLRTDGPVEKYPNETFAEIRVLEVRPNTCMAIVTESMFEIERDTILVMKKGY